MVIMKNKHTSARLFQFYRLVSTDIELNHLQRQRVQTRPIETNRDQPKPTIMDAQNRIGLTAEIIYKIA